MPGSTAGKKEKNKKVAKGGTGTDGSKPKTAQNPNKKSGAKPSAADKDVDVGALREKIETLESENMILRKNLDVEKIIQEWKSKGIPEEYMQEMFRKTLHELELKLKIYENTTAGSDEVSSGRETSGISQITEKLKKEINEKNNKIADLENNNKKLKGDLEVLKQQSRYSPKSGDEVKSDTKEAQKEWEKQYNAAVQEKNDLTKQLEQLKNTTVQEKNDIAKQLQQLKEKLDQQMITNADLQKRHDEIKIEIDELRKNKTRDTQKPEEKDKSVKELQREWDTKLSYVVQEKNDLTKQRDDLKERLEKQEKANADLQKLHDEITNKRDEMKKDKTSEDINLELGGYKSEIVNLKKEQTKLEQERDNLSKKIQEMETTRNLEGKKAEASLKEENQRLFTHLENLKREHEDLAKEKERIQKLCNKTADNLKAEEDKNRQAEQEFEHTVKEKNKVIKQLENDIAKIGSKDNVSANGNTKGLKEKLDKTNQELKDAKEEISELKNRLSKVVGAKVMDDNPNITDLSDENRPTKLSEKYSELYDNEWTDAYEELEKNNKKGETDIIRDLYKLLTDANEFCQNQAVCHAESIKSSVLSLPSAVNGRPKTPQIGVTQTRLLKELRKTFAPYLVENVSQHFVTTQKIDTKSKPKTEAFVKECVRICWLMNAQDPPVVLDTSNAKGNFDDNRFRTYTKSGKTVDFVVWPPLLLHKDGPLLCKGVAQGK